MHIFTFLFGHNELLRYNRNIHAYNLVAVISKRIMTYNKVQHNRVWVMATIDVKNYDKNRR